GSTGPGLNQLGVESQIAEILSVGPIFMQNFATVSGRAASEAGIEAQSGASAGSLEPNMPVNLGSIPWLADVASTVFDGSDVTVPPDSAQTLAGSSFGRVQVMSRSSLTISADVAIRELWLEPQSTLIVPNGVRIVIRDRWVNRGRVVSNQANSFGEVFVLGDQLLLEQPVQGLALIAPNARVTVTTMANGTRAPLVVGRTVEVQPDVTLWWERSVAMSIE